MKIFLTEVNDIVENKRFIGPYIKAQSVEEAEKIAYEHELILVGELHELITEQEEAKRIIH
jgi:uncharacterized protein YdeI (BOF family)